MNRIGVMAANTNWKYSTDAAGSLKLGINPFSSGMFAWPCNALAPRIVRGSPTNVLIRGVPKPNLLAQRTQVIRTRQKVLNTIKTVFIAHFFCTRPPYSTARAGMDMSPTSVAAVICQALSPDPSQVGYGITVFTPPGATCMKGLSGSRVAPRAYCPAPAAPPAFMQRLMFPMRGFRGHFPFVTPAVTWQVGMPAMFPECVGTSAAWDIVRTSGEGHER